MPADTAPSEKLPIFTIFTSSELALGIRTVYCSKELSELVIFKS
ncbi:MAG: hypothetical protein AAB650_01015 [Patescibacteria group bacterium]